MDNPTTRISLILRLRNREDADAWDEFVGLYEPTILRMAKQMGLCNSDAADACQEVLFRLSSVVERWNHQGQGATFRGWLYRVARNTFLNFVKTDSRKSLQTQRLNLELVPEAVSNIDSSFDLELARQVFMKASQNVRSSFSPTNWSAFWLTYVEQLDTIEVADQLNIGIGQVYVARSRVVSRLKAEVARITTGDMSWLINPSNTISQANLNEDSSEANNARK